MSDPATDEQRAKWRRQLAHYGPHHSEFVTGVDNCVQNPIPALKGLEARIAELQREIAALRLTNASEGA